MMILFLIITAALTLYATVQIVAPFFQSRKEQLRFEVLDEDLRVIEELVARRSYLLNSLRELQLDYETGKIPDSDYEMTKRKLELEAVKVLRDLDEVHGGRGWQETIDEELQQRLQGIRKRRGDEPATDADADAEDATPEESEPVAASPSDAADTDSSAEEADADQLDCPDCGKTMEADARFCSQCGHAFDDHPDNVAQTDDEDREQASESASVEDVVTDQQTDMGDTSAEVAR